MIDSRSAPGAASSHHEPRSWRDRLDDPDEQLFTMAVVANLFDMDTQALRRLSDVVTDTGQRPSGNQRRFSRRDLEVFGRALELVNDGHNVAAVLRIVELEDQVGALSEEA